MNWASMFGFWAAFSALVFIGNAKAKAEEWPFGEAAPPNLVSYVSLGFFLAFGALCALFWGK